MCKIFMAGYTAGCILVVVVLILTSRHSASRYDKLGQDTKMSYKKRCVVGLALFAKCNVRWFNVLPTVSNLLSNRLDGTGSGSKSPFSSDTS